MQLKKKKMSLHLFFAKLVASYHKATLAFIINKYNFLCLSHTSAILRFMSFATGIQGYYIDRTAEQQHNVSRINKSCTQKRRVTWREVSTGKALLERSSRVLFPKLDATWPDFVQPAKYRSHLPVNDPDCIQVQFRVTTLTVVRSFVRSFARSVSLRSTAAFICGLTASHKNADYSVRGALKSRGIHIRGMLTTYGLMNGYMRAWHPEPITLPATKIKRKLAQHRLYLRTFYY